MNIMPETMNTNNISIVSHFLMPGCQPSAQQENGYVD